MFGFKKKSPDTATTDSDDSQARLDEGLQRTREGVFSRFKSLFSGSQSLDPALLDDFEDQLLTADLGIRVTTEIMDDIRNKVRKKTIATADDLMSELRTELISILQPVTEPLAIPEDCDPFLVMMIGVNGVGKTTTIGKLARLFMQQGASVMLAAGDTFRAAAIEQLQVWGERNNVPVISQGSGADSAAVIFDALQSARARGTNILIADTAGRLHTKNNLMQELQKVVRVINKFDDNLTTETLLVLDATTGQNALVQAREFHEAVGITGIILTKLDGTARGGIVFALARELGIPIRFIGIGEKLEDLRPFDAEAFVEALLREPA